jgi:chromate transporter
MKEEPKMLAELFLTFAKIGLFTFGGGYAMIAQIKEIVVEQKKWLDDEELMQIITVAESTPGPIAINMATYVGYKKKGVAGSAMATLGVVVPSLVILYVISLFLDTFLQNKYVAYAFTGIKCGVAFLILRAGVGLFKKVEKGLVPRLTFGIVFALMILFDLLAISFSSVWFILMGGVLGIVLYGVLAPKKEVEG